MFKGCLFSSDKLENQIHLVKCLANNGFVKQELLQIFILEVHWAIAAFEHFENINSLYYKIFWRF